MIYISPVSRIYDRRDIVLCSIFFLCYLLLGLVIYSDFGIPWDEPIQRITGGVSVKYIGQILAPKLLTGKIVGFPELSSWMDRDYGVAFEAPLVILEHWFSIHDERDVYLFRHLATFLFSYVGALAFFGIVRKWFGDYRLALVATLMFILSPRMFAESFYNSKDIVFMAGFTVAIFTMMSLVERPGFRQTLTHAFATAFTIDLRVTGILILATTLVVITVKLVKGEYRIWHFFRVTGGYTALVATFVIAMFPFLWTSPLENFITTCKNMLNFRWDGHVLYLGKVILATALPWHYLTTWISVTTPPLYLVLAMTGIMIALWQLARRRLALWGSDTEMYNLTFMALLVVPVIGISAIATVLYDGWRHMYFLYTPLMLLATLGLKTIIYWVRDRRILSALVAGIVACTLLINAHWIWSAHPLQNVYFNFLVGGDWKSKFSVDYWGLSNRDALDYILANDDSSVISIRADSATPLDRSLMIFPTDARERIVVRGSDWPLVVLCGT